MANVNLDALIPREDFEVQKEASGQTRPTTLAVRDLEKDTSFMYPVLRKPDFQRETNEWDAAKISDLILSFIDGDLIPAIILWHSGSDIFVVDGAHRLSALIAWVEDDYGDGDISRRFFDQRIPTEQVEIAQRTRNHIRKRVGAYADYKRAVQSPDKYPEYAERAKQLAARSLPLLWVSGDSQKAEQSFFKINQAAAPINKTELRLLQARKFPSALAARAIMRSGTGH